MLWHQRGTRRLTTFRLCLEHGWLREASFDLFQAAESFYGAILLGIVGRKPWEHDLRLLSRLASIAIHPCLAWERCFPDADLFQLLNDACQASRYAIDFEVTVEQLKQLAPYVRALGILTNELYRAHSGI